MRLKHAVSAQLVQLFDLLDLESIVLKLEEQLQSYSNQIKVNLQTF